MRLPPNRDLGLCELHLRRCCFMTLGFTRNKRRFTRNHEVHLEKMMSRASERYRWKNQNFNKQHWKPNNIDDDDRDYHTYEALAEQVDGEYYGVKATMDVYNFLEIGKNQSSYAMISLKYDDPFDENVVAAGWHVDPERYGDRYAHFFIAWNVHRRLCINLRCQGFVLNNASGIVPGSVINQPPTHGQNITLKISKDQQTGNWLLHYGENLVGYWPKSVFTTLAENANSISWGGFVVFLTNEKSPPMGSGHFPLEGKEKAASMSDIKVIEKNGELVLPKYLGSFEDRIECYKVTTGDVILYGGPGGCLA